MSNPGNRSSCKPVRDKNEIATLPQNRDRLDYFQILTVTVTSLFLCLRAGKSSLTRIDCEDFRPCPQNEIRDCTISWHKPVDELHSIENKGDTG